MADYSSVVAPDCTPAAAEQMNSPAPSIVSGDISSLNSSTHFSDPYLHPSATVSPSGELSQPELVEPAATAPTDLPGTPDLVPNNFSHTRSGRVVHKPSYLNEYHCYLASTNLSKLAKVSFVTTHPLSQRWREENVKIGEMETVRDGVGAIVAGLCSHFVGASTPIYAKAKALQATLSWGVVMHFPLKAVESDCQALVNKIKHKWKDQSFLLNLVQLLQNYLSSFPNVSLNYISRMIMF
ncbi:hypothetical protein F8388_010678 [Cannabis sativa]|uniref:RNase H type-1 domain-containing protein n=1 Tax=Cannabis sativa TaxID=3483 RepID=A0A7J6FVL2_CANSA|nr:hypothetical protein G4B88_030072 [Cannabis sativa]KAF4378239.1 hypothetical protein F8388_010678 [Cannabis sativa]